jgi:glucan phosphoethanolaminetransferase (alkaline phosphatase superfamily)
MPRIDVNKKLPTWLRVTGAAVFFLLSGWIGFAMFHQWLLALFLQVLSGTGGAWFSYGVLPTKKNVELLGEQYQMAEYQQRKLAEGFMMWWILWIAVFWIWTCVQVIAE